MLSPELNCYHSRSLCNFKCVLSPVAGWSSKQTHWAVEAKGPWVGKLEEKTPPTIYLLDIVTSETCLKSLPRLKWQSWDHGMTWAQLMKGDVCTE